VKEGGDSRAGIGSLGEPALPLEREPPSTCERSRPHEGEGLTGDGMVRAATAGPTVLPVGCGGRCTTRRRGREADPVPHVGPAPIRPGGASTRCGRQWCRPRVGPRSGVHPDRPGRRR